MATGKFKIIEWKGKKIKVNKEEVAKIMRLQGCSPKEALEVWLCDEGFETHPDQQKLLDKSKVNKVNLGAREEKPKPTEKRVTHKTSDSKIELVEKIFEFLQTQGCENLKIEKQGKLITFEKSGEKFKLDLIKQRPPKAK